MTTKTRHAALAMPVTLTLLPVSAFAAPADPVPQLADDLDGSMIRNMLAGAKTSPDHDQRPARRR